MLETLQEACKEKGLDGPQLLEYWHGLMEPTGARDRREEFFTKVVERAESMKSDVEASQDNPTRAKDGKPVPPDSFEPFTMSRKIYELHAKEAINKLTEFLSGVLPAKRISVMYFDEAHKLDSHFWILLRFVQHQLRTRMWYTFIATKSSTSYYGPRPTGNMSGLQLISEVARLLTPYFDLGFDQRAIATSNAQVSVSMGDMQTIEFISQYGRPMWSALLPEETPGEIISLASWQLRNGEPFRPTDRDHVFAVLSQRLCLEPVPGASEAIKLGDHSVARHMRILTGISTNDDTSYTHSPSEPILVMGSIDILYNTSKPDRLRRVLDTLGRDLCGVGLVEKGVLGELGARILILIARDFAAPLYSSRGGRNLLKPIPLLYFLHTLFGRDIFTGSDQSKFNSPFGMAHVNFTHWISTQDFIPEKPQELLANLWTRGAALQCFFSQESIEFLIPSYHGSVDLDSKFDPSRLSAVVVQVKYKVAEDKQAELAIRPIGVHRDRHHLPHLVILMELGNESRYNDNGLKIKCAVSEPPADGEFGILCDTWNAAAEKLETYRRGKNVQNDTLEDLKKKTNDARLAVDSCNRYSILARGVRSPDVYGILHTANIAKEFAALLRIIMPLPVDEQSTRQHMRPLERLSDGPHTAWMSDYVVPNEDGDAVDRRFMAY
ncbi:hypothetical protein F5887DRAFT_1212486 [Amanita rubescens]|nr:hypothetical protein F5887DRAFT_1212486 [Amanita rubescens]